MKTNRFEKEKVKQRELHEKIQKLRRKVSSTNLTKQNLRQKIQRLKSELAFAQEQLETVEKVTLVN